MIDSLRAANKSFVHLDLGDFTNSEATVGDIKTRFIWKTMEQMGCELSVPGVRELTAWPLYQELSSGGRIRPLMSNLGVVQGGAETPVGRESYVADINGIRVGFFALMGGNEVTTAKPPDGIEFRSQDPYGVAQRIVPELRKEAEVVVLCSQMGVQETEELLRKVSGIDVALYGRNPGWKERAEKVAATITQQTGLRGQYAGQLVLIVDPDGRIVDWGSRNISLDTKIPENPEISAAVKTTDTEAKDMLRKSADKKTTDLEGKISSDHYIGGDKCARCHQEQRAQWASTPHAHAFATLEQDQKQADEKCVGCHVTGWRKPGGFNPASVDPDLRDVQCEACHDVGTKHGRGENLSSKVTKETCLQCHTGEWAKGFDFATYLPKVTH